MAARLKAVSAPDVTGPADGYDPPVQIPEGARSLLDLLPASLVAELCCRFGGAKVYVPLRADAGTVLAQAVGVVAAGRLVAQYGGTYLYLPSISTTEAARRRAALVRGRQGGRSVAMLARQYHLSERHVQRLLREEGLG